MRQIKRIAIIGAGSWGTAIAKDIAESKPHMTVVMWAYERSVAASISSIHQNTDFLPGIVLPLNILATNSLKEALDGSAVVILATPSKVAFDTSQKMAKLIAPDAYVGFLTKGFCKIQNEIMTISQTMEKAIPHLEGKVVAISGPSHAEEVSRRYHTCLNIGGRSAEARSVIAGLLRSEYVQCRETEDVRAVEVGGTLKNPAAIAAGMISVLPRCGDNLAGALISEALKEMIRLGALFDIPAENMTDISGLGDLVATALSDHSRNRRFGRDIAEQIMTKGHALSPWDRFVLRIRPDGVIERMTGKFNYLAEGAYAIEPLIELAESKGVSIPVYRALYEVLLNKKDPSLLVETIKDPAKFEELFFRTKIQVSDRKRGLENLPGSIFREMIINRTLDKFISKQANRILPHSKEAIIEGFKGAKTGTGSIAEDAAIIGRISPDNYDESIRKLAELYIDRIADGYSTPGKLLCMAALFVIRLLNYLRRKDGAILKSGKIDDIRRIGKSATVVYVAPFTSAYDSLFAIISIFRNRLPFPRFFISADSVRGWELYLLRRSGAFMVDPAELDNAVYREVLLQYLSTLAGHGVPLLYLSRQGTEQLSDPSSDLLISAMTESMYRHTVDIALVPVAVTYLNRPAHAGGAMRYADVLSNVAGISFSSPIFMSEYTKQPHMLAGFPGVLAGIWENDKRIFPHYIVCKILLDNGYSVNEDVAIKLVKKYISKAGRRFDYGPDRMVKLGVRYLERNGIISVSGDKISVDDRDMAEYYAGLVK